MMRLNKFLAHAGIASRRKCDDLIMAGYVKVNGKKVAQYGIVIDENSDVIAFKNKTVQLKPDYVYVLLNKPKGVVSTASDEFKRDTVLDIIAIPERIYPVGRLDYETTGVLLLTNDGELTNRLLHPRYKAVKVYRVLLDKIIRPVDLHRLRKGIELDGQMTQPCKITELRIIGDRSFLEIELKEGRYRQIRGMFEHFKYNIEQLDRITFAQISAKGLHPGEWRYLTKSEIASLKERVK